MKIRTIKNQDMRKKIFRNEDYKGVVFKNCEIDRTTIFQGCDFRQALFQKTPIHAGTFESCVGNMKEIVSLHIEGRIVNMTKQGIFIDCQRFPTYKIDEKYYKNMAIKNSKPDRSGSMEKYIDVIYKIYELKFKTKE